MRGYGSSPGSEVMGLGDWLKVSQSISAIGQTIDLKRQQERQNTIEDQNRQKEEQAAQAFNYFIENPEAMDFDNPEKQTAKPSAIGEVAGVPSERPRLPIEDYSPEAIAKARVAAMSYWTNKKTLSAESLRQTAIKAKQDKDEFIKGLSLAATSLASGDEAGAKDAFVSAYNQFYPDAHKMRVNEAGEFIMSSPTGAERNMGKPNMEQMIDEFLGSPAINEKAFAQMSLMNKRAIQEINRQSLEKPQPLYGQDGKEYFAYAQIDPESKDRTVIVTNMPAGMPGARTLTAEEITGLGLHTEDAVKFKEDRETHSATMGVRSAQENYYNDRGEAALSKGGGKQTPEDKESAKKQADALKVFKDKIDRDIEESGTPWSELTPQERKQAIADAEDYTRITYPDFSAPSRGSAISQAAWENRQKSGPGDVFDDPIPEDNGDASPAGSDRETIYAKAFEEKFSETGDRNLARKYAEQMAGVK